MPSNPSYAPVAEVTWNVIIQGDGTAASTETYYPTGTVVATPSDNNEKVGETAGHPTSLYREKRTLRMVDGILRGDLPADIEGTGWAWSFTAQLSYRDVRGETHTLPVGPFYGVARMGQTLDLATASQGRLQGGVWTSEGPAGTSVDTVTLGAGNTLVITLTDGTSRTTDPLDLSGVTATASVDTLQGATAVGKALLTATDAAAARSVTGSLANPSGGSNGQVLTLVSGAPAWATPATSGSADISNSTSSLTTASLDSAIAGA